MLMRTQMRASALERLTSSRWTLPIILLVGVGLRALLMLALPQAPMSDGLFYVLRAREIAQGLGYQESGFPTAFWPVGYPALLAGTMLIFGPSLLGPLLLNLAAAALAMLLVWWFGSRVAGSELGGRIAAFLYALYPAHLAYAGHTVTETVAAAMMMGAFALLIAGRHRPWLLVLAGLAFGAATLVRTQAILFPAGALVAMLLLYPDFGWRQALRAALIVHLAALAVVLPWSIRNQQVLGEFVFVSTNGGVALYSGANDLATGDHMALEKTPLWAAAGIPYAERVARQVEIDRRFRALAHDWIAEHPPRWARLGLRKMMLLWRKDSDGFWALKASHPRREPALTAMQWLNQAYYMAILMLAAGCAAVGARAWVRSGDPRRRLMLLFCMPAFVTLTGFVFSGQVRYHHPAMPFLVVAAGWTLARLLSAGRATR